jgi:hypothetical protein
LVATKIALGDRWISRFLLAVLGWLVQSPDEGARTSVYLATAPGLESTTGRYFHNEDAIASSPGSYNKATARSMWEKMAQMTGIGEDTP